MSEPFYEKHVGDALKLIAEKEKFLKYDIDNDVDSKKNPNFASNILRVNIFGSKVNASEATLKVFIKLPKNTEIERKNSNTLRSFAREALTYNNILPAIHKMQDSIEMDFNERFKIPRCLATSTERYKEYIMMEDIAIDGFRKPDHRETLDYNHLRLMINKVANFHGTAFALKHKHPSTYNKLTHNLKNDAFYSLEANMTMLITFIHESMKNARIFVNDPELLNALEQHTPNIAERFDYFTSKRAAEPYDVICHGDFWIANFFYKYDKDDIPIDICFFDWQVMRCGSVFTDLHYMVFLCTDTELRKKYCDQIFDWYYSDLTAVLKKFELDMNTVYPKPHFERDRKKFAPFGLIVAVSYILLITADSSNAVEGEEFLSNDPVRIKEQLKKVTPIGRQRIVDALKDYVSYQYD